MNKIPVWICGNNYGCIIYVSKNYHTRKYGEKSIIAQIQLKYKDNKYEVINLDNTSNSYSFKKDGNLITFYLEKIELMSFMIKANSQEWWSLDESYGIKAINNIEKFF